MSSSRDPEDGLVPVDPRYLETVTYHGREFQRFAVQRQIYFAPVDEVRIPCFSTDSTPSLLSKAETHCQFDTAGRHAVRFDTDLRAIMAYEDELDRLNFQHAVLALVFDDRLVFPALNNPRRILECGHGSGAWAVEVAEQFPDCQVYGVDISSHMQPDDLPLNLHLQVDDLNRRFAFARNSFDLVHSQLVAGGIDADRWPTYMRDMYRVTRPGGWCQIVEMYYQVQSYNGTLTDEHGLRQWSTRLFESMQGVKDLRKPLHLANDMREHGFVDVEQRMILMPTCAWSDDPRDNEIGGANRENVRSFLSSLAIYPFTERLGMSIEDTQLLIARARNEADNVAFKAYFPLYVFVGRKPLS